MAEQVPFVVTVYGAAALISWIVGWQAWRLRPARGAFLWAMVMFSTGVWAVGAALFTMSVTVEAGYLAQIVQYLGVMPTIYFWGAFSLAYSQFDRLLTRRMYLAMAVGPVVAFAFMATSSAHTLFANFEVVEQSGRVTLAFVPGLAFWGWAVYAYFVIVVGAILLIVSVLRFPDLYRGQALLIITAALTGLILNIVHVVFGIDVIGPYDPTSMFFTLVGIIVLLAMIRFRFLSVVPVAHDLVFKAVRSGVVVLDERNRIMDINPAALDITNVRSEQVVGEGVLESFPAYRDLITQFRDVHEIKTEVEADGRQYELQLMPLTNRSGKRSGRVIMLYDITDQKDIQADLDAYAHTVAHDLKGPVGVIQGWASLLAANYDEMSDDQRRERVDSILRSTETIRSIIDNLLLLASVRNQEDFQEDRLEMGEIVKRVETRLFSQIEAAGASLDQPDSWPVVRGFAPWVEEIWTNYITNAIKYGGEPPRIRVGHLPDHEGRARFFVQDNGPGMTVDDQTQLFTGFSRLERHAHLAGHGLGLSIVANIARKLGGSVSVDSKPGEGSTFYFSLPLADSSTLDSSSG